MKRGRDPLAPAPDAGRRRDANTPTQPTGSDDRIVALLTLIASELQSLRTAIESRPSGTSDAIPEVLTAPQLADLLQVDLRTLREMRRANEVPRGFMCGRSPRWKRSTIETWIAKAQQ